MEHPPAKRVKASAAAPEPALPASIARRSALDGRLAPLRHQEEELKRQLLELQRRRIAPLQRERDAVSGYLELAAREPKAAPLQRPC